jgi:hypothetical protein
MAQTADSAPTNIDPAARLAVTAAKPGLEEQRAAAARGSAVSAGSALRIDAATRAAVRPAELPAAQQVSGGAAASAALAVPSGNLPAGAARAESSALLAAGSSSSAAPGAPRGNLPAEAAEERRIQLSALQAPTGAASADAPIAAQWASAPSKRAELRIVTVAPSGGAQPAAKALASMSAKKPPFGRTR